VLAIRAVDVVQLNMNCLAAVIMQKHLMETSIRLLRDDHHSN